METEPDSEIDLRLAARRLLRGWRTVLATVLLASVAGGVLYRVVPSSYQAVVRIFPIPQSSFARYAELLGKSAVPDALSDPQKTDASLNIFPFTREDLLNEFVTHLRSPEYLVRAVQESRVLQAGDGEKPADSQAALAFVRSVTFSPPTDSKPGFAMQVRARNEQGLNKFVAWSLDNARLEVATRLRAGINGRIEDGEKIRKDAVASLMVDIASRRKQADDIRKDDIERLGEQARIAEALNIIDPVTVQALSLGARNTTPVIGADQPTYFQGSAALREQIDLLKNRKDNDPYTPELRDLQRQVYTLDNNGKAQALRTLVDESPLGKPSSAPLARYSLVASKAQRVFPRLSVFAIASLLAGLVIGAGIVLLRKESGEDIPAKTPQPNA